MPRVLAVIPARFASTRLPGKPLLDDTGRPMIVHVAERAAQARRVDRVIVATDDPRIRDAVESHGTTAVITRDDHPNGTSRIAEALDHLTPPPADHDLVVNVQGDEPEIEPRLIDELIDALDSDGDALMATLASPFDDGEDPADPHIVKVVTTHATPRRALYFSRRLIPFVRDDSQSPTSGGASDAALPLKHPGLYAYRRGFLPRYAALPPTPLERLEQLEQLRALEHGIPIAIRLAECRHHGIDTREQYDAFVQRWRAAHG